MSVYITIFYDNNAYGYNTIFLCSENGLPFYYNIVLYPLLLGEVEIKILIRKKRVTWHNNKTFYSSSSPSPPPPFYSKKSVHIKISSHHNNSKKNGTWCSVQ